MYPQLTPLGGCQGGRTHGVPLFARQHTPFPSQGNPCSQRFAGSDGWPPSHVIHAHQVPPSVCYLLRRRTGSGAFLLPPPPFCIRRTTGGTRLAVKWGQRALRYAAVLQRSAAKFALMSMWHVPIEGLPFTHFDSHTTWGGWLIHTQLGWWTQWTAYTWVLVNKVPAALEVMTFKQRGVLCFIFYHQTGSEKQAYQLCSTHD